MRILQDNRGAASSMVAIAVALLVVAAAVVGAVVLLGGDDDDSSNSAVNQTSLNTVNDNGSQAANNIIDEAQQAQNDINNITSNTGGDQCGTDDFTLSLPTGWECRKLNDNAMDATAHTDNNTLTFTLGKNQGLSACSVLPSCDEEAYTLPGFTDVRRQSPGAGTVEIVGTLESDPTLKLLISSNDALTSGEEIELQTIAGSVTTN